MALLMEPLQSNHKESVFSTQSPTSALYGSTTTDRAISVAKKVLKGKKNGTVTYRAHTAAAFASSRASSPSSSDSEGSSHSSGSSSSATGVTSSNFGSYTKKNFTEKSKNLVMNLVERYRSATSTKMYDVEELVDYYFHRRLAAFTAVIVSYLPIIITPNQITLFGLVLGWAAAVCLYDSEFHTPLGWHPDQSLFAASFLMFSWIVSDCADGQVARLCKRGTRTGRILDGVVDGLVIAPNCAVMALMLRNRYGEPYFFLAVGAGISLWLHALIYDKVKNVYMENALPQSECDGETVESVRVEYLEAKAKSPYALDSILLGIYVIYLTAQATFTTDAASKAEVARQTLLATCNQEYHAQYIKRYYNIIRLASFMGISAHVTGLYTAYFVAIFYWDAIFYVQLYFAVVLNIVLAIVLFLYSNSGMSTYAPNKNGNF